MRIVVAVVSVAAAVGLAGGLAALASLARRHTVAAPPPRPLFPRRRGRRHQPDVPPALAATTQLIGHQLANPAVAHRSLLPRLVELAEMAPVAVDVQPPPRRRVEGWLDAELTRLEEAFATTSRNSSSGPAD